MGHFVARVHRVQKVQRGRFLRWMGLRPKGLKFDGLSGRGLRIALRAMFIKSALRINLSASYGKITILLIGSLRSPPPIRLRRTSPASGGRIKHREAFLS